MGSITKSIEGESIIVRTIASVDPSTDHLVMSPFWIIKVLEEDSGKWTTPFPAPLPPRVDILATAVGELLRSRVWRRVKLALLLSSSGFRDVEKTDLPDPVGGDLAMRSRAPSVPLLHKIMLRICLSKAITTPRFFFKTVHFIFFIYKNKYANFFLEKICICALRVAFIRHTRNPAMNRHHPKWR